MRAFEIRTKRSDYPFLIIASSYKNAIDILRSTKEIYDIDIIMIQQLDDYKNGHIFIEGMK
jgi:hypothetical protein